MARSKMYLGDSVYAEYTESGMIRIYLDNGMGETSEIYLEGDTLRALVQFARQVGFKLN